MTQKIIICGGGASVIEFPSNIWNILSNNFVLGCNYCFHDFTPTALVAADGLFYNGNIDYDTKVHLWNKYNPVHRANLEKLPLIITPDSPQALLKPMNNTIFVKTHRHTWFKEESVLKGFLCYSLTGQLALSLACHLLDYSGEIYLLGFDFNATGKTHYHDIKHRGNGYNKHYKDHDPIVEFGVYSKEPNLKIYNVSLNSKIECFPKLTSDSFLDRIKEPLEINQETLRESIKSKLT